MKLEDSVGEARSSWTGGGCSRAAVLEAIPRAGLGDTATAAKLVGETRPRDALRHVAMDWVADGELTKKGQTRLDGEAVALGTAQREPQTESKSDETLGEARPSCATPSETTGSSTEFADSVGEAGPFVTWTIAPEQQCSKPLLELDMVTLQQPLQQPQSWLAKLGLGALCGTLPWTGLLMRSSRRRDRRVSTAMRWLLTPSSASSRRRERRGSMMKR